LFGEALFNRIYHEWVRVLKSKGIGSDPGLLPIPPYHLDFEMDIRRIQGTEFVFGDCQASPNMVVGLGIRGVKEIVQGLEFAEAGGFLGGERVKPEVARGRMEFGIVPDGAPLEVGRNRRAIIVVSEGQP
jgi:hypothetical protein